jgi:hypothetical protein
MRIVVRDEETGEEITRATGVETMILLVAPDASNDEAYRRIILGDSETSIQILFDVFQDVAERLEQGTSLDVTDVMDDELLLEMTEGLTPH